VAAAFLAAGRVDADVVAVFLADAFAAARAWLARMQYAAMDAISVAGSGRSSGNWIVPFNVR
jgi:hypothetical protein